MAAQEASASVALLDDDIEVRLKYNGQAYMYTVEPSARLSELLSSIANDFKAFGVTDVSLSDGTYLLSAGTTIAKVFRRDQTRNLLLRKSDQGQEEIPFTLSLPSVGRPSFARVASGKDQFSEVGEMRYVLVTGGVLSGIGKGMTASSIGVLFRSMGFRVTAIKIDPYLNVDAGTMSPFEHGEVFVLDDGGETDLDLGNYERFLNVTLTKDNNLTTGKIYTQVLEKERRGDYLGKTVQVVPHLTDAIVDWIDRVAHIPVDGSGKAAHVCIIELGGTVGDIESAPYIEALRQFQFRISPHCLVRIHVSLVPTIGDEEKTKPTQHSVKALRAAGLHPDVVVCRSDHRLDEQVRGKIGQFCHVPLDGVVSAYNITNLYRLPSLLHEQGLHNVLLRRLNLTPFQDLDLTHFNSHATKLDDDFPEVSIALIGKYTNLKDSYLSVLRALGHAAMACDRKLKMIFIESQHLELSPSTAEYQSAWSEISKVDGILVPGGFGDRGIEGKISALKYARTNGIPTLGVCLGMQLMVVEYARNVLGWNANSEEFTPDESKDSVRHVVVYMPEVSREVMGGTMRLGTRPTTLKTRDCLSSRLYGRVSKIDERHRHRYEVNPQVVKDLEAAGLRFVGHDDTRVRMEIVELPESVHRYYLGTQFHPEFKSRPGHPSPPFHGLILAAAKLALPS